MNKESSGATLFVSKSTDYAHPGLALATAFFNYQGIALSKRTVLESDIAAATRGASVQFYIQYRNLSFHNPMNLIEYFQREGLCRI